MDVPAQAPSASDVFPSLGGLVAGSGIFSFTLRKADGAELGLNVSHTADVRLAAC